MKRNIMKLFTLVGLMLIVSLVGIAQPSEEFYRPKVVTDILEVGGTPVKGTITYAIVVDSSLITAGGTVGIIRLPYDVQIDSVNITGVDGTTNLTFNILYSADRSSATDSLFDATQTCNNTTTGNNLATNDGDLSTAQHVWIEFVAITDKPERIECILKGSLR